MEHVYHMDAVPGLSPHQAVLGSPDSDQLASGSAGRTYRDLWHSGRAPAKQKYYHHDGGALCEEQLPPQIDPAVFGGMFERGDPIGSGAFGAVYRLVQLHDVSPDDDTKFLVKASREYVDWPPYMLRKSVGNGVYLYIMEEAEQQERIASIYLAVSKVFDMHTDEGRTHGDPHSENLLAANSGPEKFHEDPPFRRLIDELGWERVAEGVVPSYLIDPDCSCAIGERKRISNVDHEDPRSPHASEMDDLIGLLNSLLKECRVSVTRVGGLTAGPSCDFKYGCPKHAAAAAWSFICRCYCKHLDAAKAGRKAAKIASALCTHASGGESYMTSLVECAAPGDNAFDDPEFDDCSCCSHSSESDSESDDDESSRTDPHEDDSISDG